MAHKSLFDIGSVDVDIGDVVFDIGSVDVELDIGDVEIGFRKNKTARN